MKNMKSDGAHFSSVLAFLALGSTTLAFDSVGAAPATPRDELQSWIDKNAVGIRSVDPADEDFKDLEFLVDVIGNAQLVRDGRALRTRIKRYPSRYPTRRHETRRGLHRRLARRQGSTPSA